jgi:signal transduction histidine kinase
MLADYMNKHELSVAVHGSEESLHLSEAQTVLLFQSVRELLFNVWKHSASDKADVVMKQDHRQLTIQVRDEGTGFDLPTAMSTRQSTQFGLFSIREGMHALGGAFDIQSAKGQGTTATLIFPLPVFEKAF